MQIGKENQSVEIERRINLSLATVVKLGFILKSYNKFVNPIRKIYESCGLPPISLKQLH